MPLKRGYSKATQKKNFHELKQAHPEMPAKQRTAIVLDSARRSAKAAGKPGKVKAAPKRKKKG
jgi:hypothetical protein